LEAGINDWGGISPLTPDFINPEAPWPALERLREKSALAGFELRARLPIYPDYIAQPEKFISASILPYVAELCGDDGLVKNNGPLGRSAENQRSDV
jgi:FO synthase